MKNEKIKKYVADFETVTNEEQTDAEVWAAAIVPVGSEEVKIFNNINSFMNYIFDLDNCEIYFHNLSFDGNFLVCWLLSHGFSQSIYEEKDPTFGIVYKWNKPKKMGLREFNSLISSDGRWYSLCVNNNGNLYTFLDSMKLLPFSVKQIGESFETKHKKTEINYKKHKASEEIGEKEAEYISNDVLIISEGLECLFEMGESKRTIGSCCLNDFKTGLKERGTDIRRILYRLDLYDLTRQDHDYGATNADQYIRRSYRGGWCYVNEYKQEKALKSGCVYDVNSLYPFMMSSNSGNRYPIGRPSFWIGDIPKDVLNSSKYYFVRLRCSFQIKPGKLPFIQVNDFHYNVKKMLKTSAIEFNGHYYKYIRQEDGSVIKYRPVLTLSCTEFELFKEFYDIEDLEILDGCCFNTTIGLFDDYINKWYKIKQNSTGATRQIAKLFLNNLYGKLGTSPRSDYKIPYIDNSGRVLFKTYLGRDKQPQYIAAAAAVTSYARAYTIRAAQANYYKDGAGFVYADTDSIHCDYNPDKVKGIEKDNKKLGAWKLERTFDRAIFLRQKTYIEQTGKEYTIRCAGMPDSCKDLLCEGLSGKVPKFSECSEDEKLFLYTETGEIKPLDFEDFKIGLTIPGKLIPKSIPGGICLIDSLYTIQER